VETGFWTYLAKVSSGVEIANQRLPTLHAELTHSGALERIRTCVDAHLKPWIEACTVESQKMCVGTVQMAGAIAERAEENFPWRGDLAA
jgi:hypothetical protein